MLLESLGLTWPDTLLYIEDDMVPIIVDASIVFISTTASKMKKMGKKNNSDDRD